MREEVCCSEMHRFEDYTIGVMLGKGGFAKVYEAEYHGKSRCAERLVAIKEIEKKGIKWKRHQRFVRDEIENHKKSYHPNIVKLYHHLENEKKIWLILELCRGGSLEDYLKKRNSKNETKTKKGLPENEAYKIFKQIVCAVEYLHSKLIIHRDLTMRNILLTEDMQVKIVDFGLSTQLKKPDDRKYTVVGTPSYLSPEMIENEGHSEKVDCWSLGCILYALLVGKLPKEDEKISDLRDISLEAKRLLMALMVKDETKRMCIEAVSDSEFFKKNEEKSKADSYRSRDSGNGYSNYTKEKESPTRYTDSGFDSKDSEIRKKSHSMKKLSEKPISCMPPHKNHYSNSSRTRSHERSASEDRKPCKPYSSNNSSKQYRNLSRDSYKSQERWENNDCHIDSERKSYRSVHSGIERQVKVTPAISSHVGYSDNKCSQTAASNYYSHQKHQVSNCNTEKFSECKQGRIPPLNAARLSPRRHFIEQLNVVVHISTDNLVILESLKIKKSKAYVTEVLIISTDGMEMKMYKPPTKTLLSDDYPPPFPSDPTKIKSYSYSNFIYWKQYLIAKKFVDRVRAKRPKLINNGQNGKFYVMENSPDPDCRMEFYDGSIVIKNGQNIEITHKYGQKCVESMSQSIRNGLLAEFQCEKENCERILKFHESLVSPNFPIVIGTAKTGKENIAPPSSMIFEHNGRSNYR